VRESWEICCTGTQAIQADPSTSDRQPQAVSVDSPIGPWACRFYQLSLGTSLLSSLSLPSRFDERGSQWTNGRRLCSSKGLSRRFSRARMAPLDMALAGWPTTAFVLSARRCCRRSGRFGSPEQSLSRQFLNFLLAKTAVEIDRCGQLNPQPDKDERACRTPPCFNISSSLMTASATSA